MGISQAQVSRILGGQDGVGADLSLSSFARVADSLTLRPWQLLRYVEKGEIPEGS